MSSAYYPDESGWTCYTDDNGQPQHLFDAAGDRVPYAEVAPPASGSNSDGEKSDKSAGSKRSGASKHSKASERSGSSKKSKASTVDSGMSSNTPATVGWECDWCRTINYTDHQMIPFMDPLRDQNGNILYDQQGNVDFGEYPFIGCSGCDGRCTPACTPIVDPL